MSRELAPEDGKDSMTALVEPRRLFARRIPLVNAEPRAEQMKGYGTYSVNQDDQ